MRIDEKSKPNLESQPSKKYYNNSWFKESAMGISLVGGKCASCGMTLFPYRNVCIQCNQERVERLELSKKGKLFTFTKVFIPSKNFKPPYAVGYVELPEGVRIFSQIKDWENSDLKVGIEMEMVVDTLWENNDGVMVVGYKFKPVNS